MQESMTKHCKVMDFKRLIIVHLIFLEYFTVYYAKCFLLISLNSPTALWGKYCYYCCFNRENVRLRFGWAHTVSKWQSCDSNSNVCAQLLRNIAFPLKGLVRGITELPRNYEGLNEGSCCQFAEGGFQNDRWQIQWGMERGKNNLGKKPRHHSNYFLSLLWNIICHVIQNFVFPTLRVLQNQFNTICLKQFTYLLRYNKGQIPSEPQNGCRSKKP